MYVEFKLLSVIWMLASVRGDIAENPQVIKIATIIPRDKSRLFSIERVRPALEIANEKVRGMGLLPHHNITVNFADSKCSIEIGTYVKVRLKNCVCMCWGGGGSACVNLVKVKNLLKGGFIFGITSRER